MRYAERKRIDFIHEHVAHYCAIRRSDLVKKFGISLPQASSDLRKFQALHPGIISYDAGQKRYTFNREVGTMDCKWCMPETSSDPPKWCRGLEGCKRMEKKLNESKQADMAAALAALTPPQPSPDETTFDERLKASTAFKKVFDREPDIMVEFEAFWCYGYAFALVEHRAKLEGRHETNILLERIARAVERQDSKPSRK